MIYKKNLKTIRGFTKSTDLVIRTQIWIKKSRETVPLIALLNPGECTHIAKRLKQSYFCSSYGALEQTFKTTARRYKEIYEN